MKKCKQGYYYCYKDKKCKKIPLGYRVGLGGWLRREKEEEKEEETKKNGNGNGANGNGNGNGESNGGSNGGGVSEAWSSKYKKSIDCDNPKGFSQRAHCRGRKKVSEEAVSRKQQKFFGIVRAIQKGELEPTTPETAKAAATMKKSDVKKFASTKHEGLPEKKKMNEETCPICGCEPCQCLEGGITEARDGKSSKDKGYSLRDWFKGGGWKQTGGKYDGKPCAKQPGQKTKPYCRDADDRAAMSKEERNKRAAKKRKEDPNPNRKGKAKNVTQESYSNWRQDLQEKPGDGYLGPTIKVGKKEYGVPNPIRIAQDAADNTNRANQRKVDAVRAHGGTASMPPYKLYNNQTSTASQTLFGMQKQSYEPEGEVVEAKDPGPGDAMPGHAFFKNAAGGMTTLNKVDEKIRAANKKKGEFSKEEVEIVDEGKKDACYHKVKSRYSVWPSAYASGALVKCRKVGAKNWGNKSKKNESVDYSNWRDDFIPTEYETTDLIKADPIQVPPSNLQKIEEAKKCWKGYKKTGTQKLFGKTYNRCEKIKKEHYDWRAELEEGAAWTKKSGKNPSGGLNEKGRKSYERENPGSDLKRPSKKVGNKRRKSFCARMKGMKKKLTSKKTANDPNSRINKSLRAWNC